MIHTLKNKQRIGCRIITEVQMKGMQIQTLQRIQEVSTISLQHMKILNQGKEEGMHTINVDGSPNDEKSKSRIPK